MREYHQAIDQEIRSKAARPGKEETRRNEAQRLKATHGAYESRAAELLERYRMRLQITVLGAVCFNASSLPLPRAVDAPDSRSRGAVFLESV
jgi:hypothetical protein